MAYTADGVLGNPGSLSFIGDYGGIESQDDNFDTFPVWADVRNGAVDVRTMDLCYTDCPTFLQPESPIGVSPGSGATFSDLYQFNTDNTFGAGSDFWNAVGIREGADGSTVDDDLGLWNERYFSNRLRVGRPQSALERLRPRNGNVEPSKPYFIDVHNFSTSGGPYTVEWSHGHVILGVAYNDSMAAANVVRVYDTFDNTSTTYYVGLRPGVGNTSNYHVSVHLNGGGGYQGSNQDAATSGNVAPGAAAFLSVNTGSSPTGFDAIVVQNNNGGSGAYTLYRDSASPSGTVKANGGAAYTSTRHVTLTLSATNPTAGDPVSDMRFSNDGSTYGAWQAYTTSASYTVPAGNGLKKIFVEFRNGAGAVSAAANSSITLDTTPPTTSVLTPASGAHVHGSVTLDASASDNFTVAKVKFALTGGADNKTVIATATLSAYGWLASWNSAAVPAGAYTLQSLAFDAAGNSAYSAGVTIERGQHPSDHKRAHAGERGACARERHPRRQRFGQHRRDQGAVCPDRRRREQDGDRHRHAHDLRLARHRNSAAVANGSYTLQSLAIRCGRQQRLQRRRGHHGAELTQPQASAVARRLSQMSATRNSATVRRDPSVRLGLHDVDPS